MSGRTKVCLWLFFLCLAVFASATACAQSIYLCLDTNSTNLTPDDYQNCAVGDASKIEDFSFGVTSPPLAASGASIGPAIVSSLTLDKRLDATSKQLLASLLSRSNKPLGQTLAIGMIARAPVLGGNSPLNNITLLLRSPIVTSVTQKPSAGTGVFLETIILSFDQLTVIDNTVSPPKTTTWTAQ